MLQLLVGEGVHAQALLKEALSEGVSTGAVGCCGGEKIDVAHRDLRREMRVVFRHALRVGYADAGDFEEGEALATAAASVFLPGQSVINSSRLWYSSKASKLSTFLLRAKDAAS